MIDGHEDLIVLDEDGVDHGIWKPIDWSGTWLDADGCVYVEVVQLLHFVKDLELVVAHILIGDGVQIALAVLDNIFGLDVVALKMNLLSASEAIGVILLDD